MRPEVVEKRLNSILRLACQGKRINGLFRLLACPMIWERAYETIAPNQGALTPGTDPDNTLDGFSLERMNRIITEVMDGSYRFTPARRTYIPKPNGKKRPLGIPTADDKLVQAAVKIILDHVYEPIFSVNSHGFRQGRSCHTALDDIKHKWPGVKWLIDVDVVGYFDNIDHDTLLDLLRTQIDDEKLIRLIGRMLKAGYMEDWTYHDTFSGTPQGGVISPILANIYLHELDKHMGEMKANFDKGKVRRTNPAYQSLSSKIYARRCRITRNRAKNQTEEETALFAEIRELEQTRSKIPCSDWFDPDYRRLLYCRYADDFLIGIIGSKEEARSIMAEVKEFLANTLKLTASEEKSGISKATDGTTFLGYKVGTYSGERYHRRKTSGRTTTARIAADRVQLHAPRDKLAKFVERHHLGNYHTNRGDMRPGLINSSDLEILDGYNALMRGLAEYYKLGTGWRREIGRVYHIWWWSFHKTLARKHKCSVAQIAQKLQNGNARGLWYEGKNGRRFKRVFRLKDVKDRPVMSATVDREPHIWHMTWTSDLMDRLKARECTACGTTNVPVEIHHAKRMADMQGTALWTKLKAARTRKRVVLCRECHDDHHAGRLQARLDRMDAGAGAG